VDGGGVVQIYGFNDVRKWLEKEEGQKRTGAARDFSKVPVLLYEQKISLEAIDVLKWSPDDNFLAAGSHDNYVYVLGKTVPGGSDAESAWKALWDSVEWDKSDVVGRDAEVSQCTASRVAWTAPVQLTRVHTSCAMMWTGQIRYQAEAVLRARGRLCMPL
jgi:hypothetical protein